MPAKDKDVGIPSPSFAHTTSLSRILAGLDRLFYWPLHLKLYFIKLTKIYSVHNSLGGSTLLLKHFRNNLLNICSIDLNRP